MKKYFYLCIAALVGFCSNAQYEYRDSNRIGISGGLNYFTLDTKNFQSQSGTGWSAGLSVRGNFYNDFDMVYGLQFSENRFSVATLNGLGAREDVDYKLPSAQVYLLLSYKFIENHLSAEIGPMFQINGNTTIDENDEDKVVAGNLYTAKDLTDISKFSFYPTVGLTVGVRHFRLQATYQYGVTNLLNNLNNKGFGDDFKGHASIFTGTLIIYL
ncbi:MAG: PorT family protein [Flavobacterium sp.]|nr:MAG: PorT family protein [Flavobacterium sp.]